MRVAAGLWAWIAAVVAARGNRPAIVEDGHVISYAELAHRARRLAHALLYREAPADDCIGLLGPNSADYLWAYLGVQLAGATVVPISPLLSTEERLAQLRLVGARTVIGCHLTDEERAGLSSQMDVLDATELDRSPTHGLPLPEATAPGCILLTSGSTGRPKGVVHTQATLLHAALQLAIALPFGARERSIAFLPFFASIPEQVLPTLLCGGTIDVIRQFDPERISRACKEATCLDAVPTLIARLLDDGDLDAFRRLSWVMFASEPMPVPVLERWWDELPGVDTHQFYGMTELLTITHASHDLLRREPRTVGVPFATSLVETVDGNGSGLNAGAVGEVACHSPARMTGYFEDDEATAAALGPSGAMHTGDLGEVDDQGRLFLTGRLKDLIISGGLNIAPVEIEEVACRHPAVAAAAVVGIPHPRWGETPVVVAVGANGHALTPDALLDFCRRELHGYKRPSGAAVVDALPVTGIGKAAKQHLRDEVLRGAIELVRHG